MYQVRDGTVLIAERAAFHIWDRDGSAEIGLVHLQNRDWFMPMVAGMALLLVYLTLKEILRLRQLAQTNEQLQREIQP